MAILNKSKGRIIAKYEVHATTFLQKLRGLLGTKCLPSGCALVLHGCNSVHMMGMIYSIDVIFADCNGRVLYVLPGLKPWRVSSVVRSARYAIEVPVGVIGKTKTDVGDLIMFTN